MKKKKLLLIALFVFVLCICQNVSATECVSGSLEYVSCGSGANKVTGIPKIVPELTALFITILQIIVPIVLIIIGMIDMTKAISTGASDAIAKNKTKLIKKFIAAVIAFMVITITTNVIKIIAEGDEKSTFVACMSCYLNNKCDNDCTSYKTDDSGTVAPSSKKFKCEDYRASNCPKMDEAGVYTCTVINNECQSDKYASCKSYTQTTCSGKVDANGYVCTLGNGGVCQASRTKEDGTKDVYKCENYNATNCPKMDDSGTYLCIVSGNSCKSDKYVNCSSYTQSTCSGKTDANGNLCSLGNGGVCEVVMECSMYTQDKCNGSKDSHGRNCKQVYEQGGVVCRAE